MEGIRAQQHLPTSPPLPASAASLMQIILMKKVYKEGARSRSFGAPTPQNTSPKILEALSELKSETNIKASKYMNFAGIITPNCSVKDLPFHQIAAAEKLQEREIRAKSHLLALTAIKALANHKLLFFFLNKHKITEDVPIFSNLSQSQMFRTFFASSKYKP